jgi:NPCBM/NEW2 domain
MGVDMNKPLYHLGLLAWALIFVACPSQPDSNPYAGGITHPWQSQPNPQTLAFSPVDGDNALSDLEYSSASSGWGPIEKDRSNGENQPGDGKPMTIGGQVYPKGLGVHADSSLSYALGGKCTRFSAEVGMDDEIDANPNRNGDRVFVYCHSWVFWLDKFESSGAGSRDKHAQSARVAIERSFLTRALRC